MYPSDSIVSSGVEVEGVAFGRSWNVVFPFISIRLLNGKSVPEAKV